MPEPGAHYIDCIDLLCGGCLPTDDEVSAMSIGQATIEAQRRGLDLGGGRARLRRLAILNDADDYRARSATARSTWEASLA